LAWQVLSPHSSLLCTVYSFLSAICLLLSTYHCLLTFGAQFVCQFYPAERFSYLTQI
jgi:hypothetical protein